MGGEVTRFLGRGERLDELRLKPRWNWNWNWRERKVNNRQLMSYWKKNLRKIGLGELTRFECLVSRELGD